MERGIRLTGNCEMSGCIAGLAENARKKSARQLWRDTQCEVKETGQGGDLAGDGPPPARIPRARSRALRQPGRSVRPATADAHLKHEDETRHPEVLRRARCMVPERPPDDSIRQRSFIDRDGCEPLRLRVETSGDPCRNPATAAGGARGVVGAGHCDANDAARSFGRRQHGFDCSIPGNQAMAKAGHA